LADFVAKVGSSREGEGDRTLAYWRSAHRAYFGRLGRFGEDMMLMCERFRLVEVFGDLPYTES
jgi:uncharacterized protein YhfF